MGFATALRVFDFTVRPIAYSTWHKSLLSRCREKNARKPASRIFLNDRDCRPPHVHRRRYKPGRKSGPRRVTIRRRISPNDLITIARAFAHHQIIEIKAPAENKVSQSRQK
jgi:hypothetical protein